MPTEHEGEEQGPQRQESRSGEDLEEFGLEKMIEALAAALKRGDPRLAGFKPGGDAVNVTVKPDGAEGDPLTVRLRVVGAALLPAGTMERRRKFRKRHEGRRP